MILTAKSIANAILTGAADENLTAIYEAFRTRSKLLRQQKAAVAAVSLRPGLKCKVLGIRPKYLNNQIVTVERIDRTTATVKWDDPKLVSQLSGGRDGGAFGATARIPVTCLEVINA